MNKIIETIQIDIVADHLPAGLSSSSSFLREHANRIALPERAGFIFKGSITPIEPLFSLFQILPLSAGVNPGVSIVAPTNLMSGTTPQAVLADVSVDVPLAFNGTRARLRGSITVYDELDAPDYTFSPIFPLSSGTPWPSSVEMHSFPNDISALSISGYGSTINLKNCDRLPPGAYILPFDLGDLSDSFVAANDEDTAFLYVLNDWSPNIRQTVNTIVTPVFDVVMPQQTRVQDQIPMEESLSGIRNALDDIATSVAALSTNPPTLYAQSRTTGENAFPTSAGPRRLQFLARMLSERDVVVSMSNLDDMTTLDIAQLSLDVDTKTPIVCINVQISGSMSADSSDPQTFEFVTSPAAVGSVTLFPQEQSGIPPQQIVSLMDRDESVSHVWVCGQWIASAQTIQGVNLPVGAEIPLAYMNMTQSGGEQMESIVTATIVQLRSRN